jgi:prepilin-type processing-associated H-X9-DG protein
MQNDIEINSEQGFTIWELLCILFVIFLLFALLMPALERSRSMATGSICRSYLREYCLGGILYLDDNDGMFPKPSEWLYTKKSDSEDHPIGCRWHDQLMAPSGRIMRTSPEFRGEMWEYFSEEGIGPCPSFRRFARSRGCENPNHKSNIEIRPQYSYTMNGYLGTTKEGGVLNRSEVRAPSEVFFFSEENSWSLRPDHPKYPARWLSAPLSTRALDDTVLLISPTPEAKDCFATYHGSGDLNRGYGNVALIDGHVERIRAKDQLRKNMHGGRSELGPAGNLIWAWPVKLPPPGGWDAQ